ncbi:MAG TPA: SRPBCC domain-containing protein [Steroidobacteraceae bacterium]|nr:SRPBCC domain-containing protein [Steroidobacteraceae bacterium]
MAERVRGYAHRVDIAADAGKVWRAITEPQSLSRWCSPEAELQPRQGGLFRARVDRVTELEAHIDVFEAGRRLRLIYLPTPALPRAESVITDDLIVEAVPEGTVVRLLGSGVPGEPEWDTQYWRLRTAWLQALNRLKVLVEAQPGAGGAR